MIEIQVSIGDKLSTFNWLVLKDTIKLLLIELKLIKPNIISNINNNKQKNILMLDLGIILNILKKKSFVKKSDGKSLSMNNVDFKRIKFDLKSISSLKKYNLFVSKIILSLFVF